MADRTADRPNQPARRVRKTLGGSGWTHWVDSTECTQWKRTLAPNALMSFHWVQAIRRTQCIESVPLGALTSRVGGNLFASRAGSYVVSLGAFLCCALALLSNVRHVSPQRCSPATTGDLRVPRPLAVYVYSGGSRSCATRLNLLRSARLAALYVSAYGNSGGVGRCVRASALGPGRRSRRSRAGGFFDIICDMKKTAKDVLIIAAAVACGICAPLKEAA